MRLLIPAIVLLLSLSGPLRSQDDGFYSDDAETGFLEGLERFTTRDFVTAYVRFAEVLRLQPRNQRTTAAYIMAAKSLFQLSDFDQSVQLLNDFLRDFPESRYIPDAHFTLGTNYYALHRYEGAAAEFVKVIDRLVEKAMSEKAQTLLVKILEQRLDAVALNRVLKFATTPDTKFLVSIKTAEKLSSVGRNEDARALLVPLVQHYPDHRHTAAARDLLRKFETKLSFRIGVVLPLFTYSSDTRAKEIGQEILDGIEYAAEEFRTTSGLEIGLQVLDSQAEPTIAAKAVHSLSAERDIIAILGPVYSAEVSASAKAASDSGVPLISPTATSNGLASLGKYVFQANPNYDLRGRAMARYAMEELGLKSFAVLAPGDSYGKFMAESFVDEVTLKGGKLLGVEWYQKGATEFRDQLMRLRGVGVLEAAEYAISFAGKVDPGDLKKLIARGVPRPLLDSLVTQRGKVRLNTLWGVEGKRIADSLQLTTFKDSSDTDSLDVPVTSIDGFYLPVASPEEIGILSSQLAYYNFKTQMLGSGEWYNPVELDANSRYTDGVIFDSDTYADPTDPAYLKFFDGFYQANNSRPTKNTLFGYDTARLLLTAIGEGARTRDAVAAKLLEGRSFLGLRTLVSFNKGRVNAALNILRYKRGEVTKLGDLIVKDGR